MVGREIPIPGAVFTGHFHTSPTNAATLVSRGCGGYTRHPSPRPRTQRLTGRNRGPSLHRPQRGFVLSAKLPPKEQSANRVCPPRAGGRGLAASRPRWAAQPERCRFRSRERFSLAEFVLTISSPAPAAVPVPLGTAVRSRGDSCRSAPGRTHPSFVPAHPAPPR